MYQDVMFTSWKQMAFDLSVINGEKQMKMKMEHKKRGGYAGNLCGPFPVEPQRILGWASFFPDAPYFQKLGGILTSGNGWVGNAGGLNSGCFGDGGLI